MKHGCLGLMVGLLLPSLVACSSDSDAGALDFSGDTPGQGAGTGNNAFGGGAAGDGATGAGGSAGGNGATGGSAGDGAGAVDPNQGGDGFEPAPMEDPGGASTAAPEALGDGSQVIWMGDSYVDYQSTLIPELASRSGKTYRSYADPGVRLTVASLFGPPVRDQLPLAMAENPDIKTVIHNGGLNDIQLGLTDTCSTLSSKCESGLQDIREAFVSLMSDHEAAGVQDVVYFGYPILPGRKAVFADAINRLMELLGDECDARKDAPAARCHFVDPRDSFEGHPEYIESDDIHPTDAGDQIIAQLIWDKLSEHVPYR